MRFKELTEEEKFPEIKTKQFFAFWPVTINKETRWLETVIVTYKRKTVYPWGENYFLKYYYTYIPKMFN